MVVTGGGTGIGAETALYFAEAGATRIALLGRREQPLLDTKASIKNRFADAEVFVASTDVTKKSEVDAAFTKFVDGGKIDVLVSNAAMVGPPEPVRDADGDKLLDAVHQNLKGSLFVAQAFLRYTSTDAVVINVSSAAAHLEFGPARFASYSIAKLAIVRLWDSLAFANPELNVFHVQPGVVNTAMNREAGGIDFIGHEDDGRRDNCLRSRSLKLTSTQFLYQQASMSGLQARKRVS